MTLRTLSVLITSGLVALATPATAASRTYEVPSFDAVDISAGISAVVDVGSPQSVSAETATYAQLQKLDVRVDGGTLRITIKQNALDWLFNFGASRSVTVHVAAPALKSASSSAGSNVDVHHLAGQTLSLVASSGASLSADAVTGDFLTLDSSSGASLTASGTCGNLIANVSSGGNLEARALACVTANANASSGGHATVRASTTINADASSGGGIAIYGRPATSKVTSSIGGSVEYAD